jgi:hypothetical protein
MFFHSSPDVHVANGTVNPQVLHPPIDPPAHLVAVRLSLARDASPVAHEDGEEDVSVNGEAIGRALVLYAIPTLPFGTVPRIGVTPSTPTPTFTMVAELRSAANFHRAPIVSVRIARPFIGTFPTATTPDWDARSRSLKAPP